MNAAEPSSRAALIRQHFERLAPDLLRWRGRNAYYHGDQERFLRYLVEPGKRVLMLGSGPGHLLAALQPSEGLGIDISPALVADARARFPELRFEALDAERLDTLDTGPFDYIVLSDLVGYLDDVQSCLRGLHRFCHPGTRLIISYYSFLWQPVLRLGEKLGLKMPTPEQSWLSLHDLTNLLTLADFQVVKTERRLLFPKFFPLLSWLLNHLGNLPGLNLLCLSQYVVARVGVPQPAPPTSVTVVIPCRNERGNIEAAIQRMPAFGRSLEIIFVDGHSDDGTRDEILRVKAAYADRNILLLDQTGTGKGQAVRQGFAAATGDILMILDADLTVPPEDLPKFHDALAGNKAEFLNGCRLVYPLEDEAMQTLNLLANKAFAWAFTWLLGQRLKDTLCGTKVLRRSHYEAIVANRGYFGDFDPFGDFDLLFGASKLNLKILEVPVRYRNRRYGETKIHRFRHGWLLLRMVVYAYRKLKSV